VGEISIPGRIGDWKVRGVYSFRRLGRLDRMVSRPGVQLFHRIKSPRDSFFTV
jgi:hypothetical protein